MSTENEREDQVLDHLIVAALRGIDSLDDLPDLDGPEPQLSEEDEIALAALGEDLIQQVLERANRISRVFRVGDLRTATHELAGSLHRSEDETELSEEIRDALERKVREMRDDEEEGEP
jgi:hypothetical protein